RDTRSCWDRLSHSIAPLVCENCDCASGSNPLNRINMRRQACVTWSNMIDRKLLIDTNIFIGLEDQTEVAPELASMVQLCNQHDAHIFIHEAAVEDINRDKDIQRRKVSLSKLAKFEQLKGIPCPPDSELVARFGPMPKPNDKVDVALLHALDIG